ncbi:TetR/AcrR family transcriptional regulator [Sphingomonas alpina]|uniref:TetR/AcrR family transcriptional regulator n=1 Tax=Sphingomonas alpina TaxID=653931 RepID=A0A7H0LDH7_9SPHN|nr:TetR/AcrR family transcriptional regulator [Sphingomonas alpina]QNQ07730.1 TetR/AcrR family transcriptional regulator [Sphingomonas alpina]
MATHETKIRFLRAAGELFRAQGYAGTGLKQIVAEAGAPWGSMYHFFPGGKEQLAVEAILYAGEHYGERMKAAFERAGDPRRAIQGIFANEVQVLKMSDYRDGCPIASTAIDVASTVEAVRSACATVFSDWLELIAEPLGRAGLPPAKAAVCAHFVLSSLEGAIILSRTLASGEPLVSAGGMVDLALERALAGER